MVDTGGGNRVATTLTSRDMALYISNANVVGNGSTNGRGGAGTGNTGGTRQPSHEEADVSGRGIGGQSDTTRRVPRGLLPRSSHTIPNPRRE